MRPRRTSDTKRSQALCVTPDRARTSPVFPETFSPTGSPWQNRLPTDDQTDSTARATLSGLTSSPPSFLTGKSTEQTRFPQSREALNTRRTSGARKSVANTTVASTSAERTPSSAASAGERASSRKEMPESTPPERMTTDGSFRISERTAMSATACGSSMTPSGDTHVNSASPVEMRSEAARGFWTNDSRTLVPRASANALPPPDRSHLAQMSFRTERSLSGSSEDRTTFLSPSLSESGTPR